MKPASRKSAAFSLSLVALLCVSALSPHTRQTPVQAKQIINDMLAMLDRLKGMECRLVRMERFNGSYSNGELVMKVNVNPFKVYARNLFPDAGAELLLVSGWNRENALVYPNRFPWINLNFDPHSSTLMTKQHHSLRELGYAFFSLIVKDALKKHGSEFEKYVSYKGTVMFSKRACHHVEINYSPYAWVNYTVQPGEDLFIIERKLVVPAYMVMERNRLSGFDDVEPGQVIQVPNVYAKRSVVYIDKETLAPLLMEVHDDAGMFERYEYRDLVLNPVWESTVFTPTHPGYSF